MYVCMHVMCTCMSLADYIDLRLHVYRDKLNVHFRAYIRTYVSYLSFALSLSLSMQASKCGCGGLEHSEGFVALQGQLGCFALRFVVHSVCMPCAGDEMGPLSDSTSQSSSGPNPDDFDDSEAWLTELLAYGREKQRRRF